MKNPITQKFLIETLVLVKKKNSFFLEKFEFFFQKSIFRTLNRRLCCGHVSLSLLSFDTEGLCTFGFQGFLGRTEYQFGGSRQIGAITVSGKLSHAHTLAP